MRSRQGGFTLIEVVVAFAILVLSLGALYQSFSLTLRHGEHAAQRGLALLHAQSLLARVGRDLPLRAGTTAGTGERGFGWSVVVAELAPPSAATRWPVPAYEVSVTVSWGESPADRLSLRSLELGVEP